MPDYTTRRIEVQPRPHPLHLVSMANADEFLQDGDIGLSVGEGHFPARVIQNITGSPYVHTIGVYRDPFAEKWLLCESAPSRVRIRPLAEMVAKESGLYDFYRLTPGLCDLNKAWAWACAAEGALYSYYDLWLVWRRRYRKAVAEGRCEKFDFPSLGEFCRSHDEAVPKLAAIIDSHWNPEALTTAIFPGRIPDPVPNSDDPCNPHRDCSHFCAEAMRFAGLTPMVPPYTCDWVPGDFSVAPLFEYAYTLVDNDGSPETRVQAMKDYEAGNWEPIEKLE